MKIEMKKDGILHITAENPLESYALKAWFGNYEQGDDSSRLQLEVYDDSDQIDFAPEPDEDDFLEDVFSGE